MTQQLVIKTASLSAKPQDIIAIYSDDGPVLQGEASVIWNKTGLEFEPLCIAASFTGKPGQMLDVLSTGKLGAKRLLVLRAGKSDDEKAITEVGRKDRGGSLVSKLVQARAASVSVFLDTLDADAVADIAAGMRLRHYKFDKYKTKKKPEDENGEPAKLTVVLHVSDKSAADKAISDRMAVVEGTLLARDLVNEPPNALGPVEFAERMRELSKLGVDVDILTPGEMEKLGMGSLLAVGRGSERPSRLAVMQWHGGKKKDAPVAFIGKGVVFDTGGISIKPAGSMEDMKGDMGGAAAVAGLMRTVALRQAKANVVGVIGLVENMPDGNAYRPGDILTSMSGQTIEVINTDAEGRLVLADALWYTQDRFKPKHMVNLATLTGAIMVSLGQDYAGLFSNNDELAVGLYEAGLASGEKVWRMPMGPAYDKLIESRFADMKNTGGRYGGSITAAQFLQRFVNNVAWAHLDIAGAAFGTPPNETSTGWTTGFGVALLDKFVRDNHEN
jgi:leucyl aminopeptidase